jgi:hypothetical protein
LANIMKARQPRNALLASLLIFGTVLASAQPLRSTLNAVSAAANSGATDLSIGDKLYGPGAITVGWLGVKKQLLIPNGEWVVVAATDHNSSQAIPSQLTSMALGQFDGNAMKSLIIATFNRRPGSQNSNWNDAARCEIEDQRKLYIEKEGPPASRRCVFVRPVSNAQVRKTGHALLWQDLRTNLDSLNGKFGEFNLESAQYVVDSRGSYLRVVRFDCTQTTSDGKGCAAIDDASVRDTQPPAGVEARIAWAKIYFRLAAPGFNKELNAENLTPGTETRYKSVLLPD